MMYKEDVNLVITFLAALFVSWLVFLRFVNVAEFNLLTLSIFIFVWLASVIVAMLPVFTPLILAFSTVSRKIHKRSVHAHIRNTSFVFGYISVWIILSALFYFAMQFFGYILSSASIYIVVGYAAVVAGLYKIISLEHINTPKIMSPELFFSKHWRDGHKGACAMGAHHAAHIISSYWLLVLIMLVAGFANFLLLGILSVTIFLERISSRPVFLSRIAGLCFVVAGIGLLLYAPFFISLVSGL